MTNIVLFKRIAALIVDYTIVIILTFLISILAGIIIYAIGLPPENFKFNVVMAWAIGAVVFVLYYTVMESSKYQATLGKMLLQIKVQGVRGEKLSVLQALSRTLGKVISAVPLLAGFFLSFFTKKKQALHDILSHSLVVDDTPKNNK